MTRPAYYNENDPYCCQVLRERIAEGWLPPGDVDERDIRLVNPLELREHGQVHLFAGIGGGGLACRLAGVPDDFAIITGGVPCQPSSGAGEQKGRDDERWLWPEALNVLRALGSHVALLENPPSLLALHDGREFGDILAELAALGRAVEWDCVPAAAVGAPHQRDRLWLIAYPDGCELRHFPEREGSRPAVERHALALYDGAYWPVADPDGGLGESGEWDAPERVAEEVTGARSGRGDVADTLRGADGGLHLRRPDEEGAAEPSGASEAVADAGRLGLRGRGSTAGRKARPTVEGPGTAEPDARWRGADWWAVEPDVGRVAHGIPARVDRLRALGNAWVPQAAVPALRVILARLAPEAVSA